MADFDAIDALLASASSDRTPLPPAEERRRLREGLNLSRAQLAQALGVSPSTVGGWESGRDPSSEVREKYAYFLEGARTKLDAAAAAAAPADDPGQGDDGQAKPDQAVGTDDAASWPPLSRACCAGSPPVTRSKDSPSTWTLPNAPRPRPYPRGRRSLRPAWPRGSLRLPGSRAGRGPA